MTVPTPLRYLSVCSGIEAASVAWEQLGWEAIGFSEIEAFPCAVLRHRFPDVPLHGDFTALIESPPSCDVLVGGTPCQAFSVAGSRRSLDDARGNLTLAYVELANAIDRRNLAEGKEPCITVWENVPGVFSTGDNAFGCLLRGLAGGLSGEDGPLEPPGGKWTHAGIVAGPQRAVAWRVLDAQYFGLAQRRQRVFVVSSARDGFDPSQVLLEWEGVRRDSAPSREARKDAAAALGGGVEKRRGEHGRDDGRGRGNGRVATDVVGAITARYGGQAMGAPEVDAGLYIPLPETEVVGCLSDGAHNGGGLNGQDAYTGRILATVAPAHALSSAQGSFPWPQEVADPLTSNEAKTYTQEGSHNFRTRNVVPHVVDARVDEDAAAEPPAYCYPDADQLGYAPGDAPGNAPASTPLQAPFVFDTTQVTHPENRCQPKPGDPSHPLAAAGHPPTLAASAGQRMVVRRLTPRECERLQGFPSVVFRGTFGVCLCSDRHQKSARAAQTSRRSQSSACPVEEQECCVLAPAASDPLSASPLSSERRAVVRALIDLERNEVQLLNQGKSSSLVKSAPESVSFPLSTEVAASVLRLVEQSRSQEKDLLRGEAGSPRSTMLSTAPSCGKSVFEQSGKETLVAAENAQRSTNEENRLFRSTTSPADRDSPTSGLISPTLCSCVWTVIASSIPERTLPQSSCFDVSLEIVHGWTLIPWKGKPAVDCPDGPRYKALGNSMAVPVMRWIGRRIDAYVKEHAQ